MTPVKDAREAGYPDCLDREKASEWLSEASLTDLHSALLRMADIERSVIAPEVALITAIFESDKYPFSPFVDKVCLTDRIESIDSFRFGFGDGPPNWISFKAVFPEFYDLWNMIHDAAAAHEASTWEKAHSWMTREFDDPLGPGDLESFTYASKRGSGWPTSAQVRSVLFEWATRIIKRGDDQDAATRAASGEMSIAEVESIWRDKFIGAYYIWSPRHGERVVCDGIVLRLDQEFDLSGYEYWTDAAAIDFLEGPIGGMAQVEGAIWLFWTLLGSHDLLDRAPPSTLTAWGWAFSHAGRSGEPPWHVHQGIDRSGNVLSINSILIASSYAFAGASSDHFALPSTLLSEALNFVCQSQMETGAWSDYLGDGPSVIATTMAAWALQLTGGFNDRVEKALRWLSDSADPAGGWSDQQHLGRIPAATLTFAILELHHAAMTPATSTPTPASSGRRFRVALTFPGEARDLVEPIAEELEAHLGREQVFYDRFYEAELARPNLDTHLQEIYRNQSDLVIPFLGSDYQRKDWCGIEWRAVRDIMKERDDDRIMMMRLDDGVVDGTFDLDGYIDINGRSASELSALILQRLGSI